jgi:signal transduction histidine kinase
MAALPRPARTRSLRFILAGLLIIPLVSLLALYGFAVSITYGNYNRDKQITEQNAQTSEPEIVLTALLETERAQTYAWLTADRQTPEAPLTATRAKVSAAIPPIRQGYKNIQHLLTRDSRPSVAAFFGQLAQLPNIRSEVDAGTLSPTTAFQDYTAVIQAEFHIFLYTGPTGDATLSKESIGTTELARVDQAFTEETALVDTALANHGQMSTPARLLFANTVANQRVFAGDGLTLSGPLSAPYAAFFKTPVYQRFAALEDRISDSTGSRAPIPVTGAEWTAASGAFGRQYEVTELAGANRLVAASARLAHHLLIELILAGGAGLLGVLLSVFLMLWFGRRLTGDLTNLNDGVESMANDRLPRVVERLRDGDDVDVAAESPPPVPARITEIARVGQSFAQVQHTAVEAAVGQANLRKGVNQVFLNLSLRNQSLLHRQLGLLDAMERATSEPAALADLFRLDHLTTRMRRHAEGLIILSGATPGRGWHDPVPAVDVLRAAIAEVEDYVRVDVVTESRDSIVGVAVNDVIHLIAELAENATSFSPPNTQVEIKADSVGAGFAVEIEDRGLGLTPDELAEINQRLASPPEFDLARSDQLGLYVVGQLAVRHGIKVSLHESPYGGTRAIVLMPRSIIVRDGETADYPGRDAGRVPPAHEPEAGGMPPARPGPDDSRERASVFSMTGRHRLAGEPTAIPAGSGTGPPPPAPAAAAEPPWPDAPSQEPWLDAWHPVPRPRDPGDDLPSTPRRELPAPPRHGAAEERPEPRRQASPRPGGTRPAPGGPVSNGTHLGMPRRVRQASLAPQLKSGPAAESAASSPPPAPPVTRSPEQARSLMAALQTGWQQGRTDDLDEPGWPGETRSSTTDSTDGEAT